MTDTAERNGCDQFASLDALRVAMNAYLLERLWGAQEKSKDSSWFEESRNVLVRAFGVFCSSRLPDTPAEPQALKGATVDAIRAELRPIVSAILKWTLEAEGYIDCVRRRSSPSCQSRTAQDAVFLRAATRDLRRLNSLESNKSADYQLCLDFYGWSTLLHQWSEAFAACEQALFDCLKVDRGLLDSEAHDVYTEHDEPASEESAVGIKQISPAPWPPWEVRVSDDAG